MRIFVDSSAIGRDKSCIVNSTEPLFFFNALGCSIVCRTQKTFPFSLIIDNQIGRKIFLRSNCESKGFLFDRRTHPMNNFPKHSFSLFVWKILSVGSLWKEARFKIINFFSYIIHASAFIGVRSSFHHSFLLRCDGQKWGVSNRFRFSSSILSPFSL